jgi:L-alanine-DL-glutamate epimerase-like enolase superfamily enzyme
MRIEHLRFRVIEIPFRTVFSHANATRSEAEGIWVEAYSVRGATGCGEGCPRDYVTGETVRSARTFFDTHRPELEERIRDLASLQGWVSEKRREIDANPAAWCAIELALLAVMAEEQGLPVEALLGLPAVRGEFRYSAVLGDMECPAFRRQFARYREMGFTDFKLKTSGCHARDRCKSDALREEDGARLRVRLDANNTWRNPDDAIAYLRSFDYPYFAVEEPLIPNAYRQLERVAAALGTKIILDESLARMSQLAELRRRPETWIINLRVSKMGGLLRSIELVRRARDLEIPLIVGAHVGETSLLTRVALTVAKAAGSALLAQEGAFGTYLLERDVCESPIVFGRGGSLAVDEYLAPGAPGFGLVLNPEWTATREVRA